MSSISGDHDFAAGVLTMRDVFATYGFDNGIGVVTMTGDDVRAVLERASGWFVQIDPQNLPATPDAATLGPAYTYDIASGVQYTLDVTQPVGSRVTSLKYQGVDVTPTQTFKVVTSSYRIFGGDGYPVHPTAPVLAWSDQLVVEALATRLASAPFAPASSRVCDYALVPDLEAAYYGSAVCP